MFCSAVAGPVWPLALLVMALPAVEKELAVHDQPVQYSNPENGNGEPQDVELATHSVDIARIEKVYRYDVPMR